MKSKIFLWVGIIGVIYGLYLGSCKEVTPVLSSVPQSHREETLDRLHTVLRRKGSSIQSLGRSKSNVSMESRERNDGTAMAIESGIPQAVTGRTPEARNLQRNTEARDRKEGVNLGIYASYPKGAIGIDLQVFRFYRFGVQVGVGYEIKEEKAEPQVSLGYNIERLSRITHNTSIFIGYAPLGNKVTGGIRVNL